MASSDGKLATMQEVAQATGLSVSTVSRVLNSSDFAREDTRNRVIKAANRLGYVRLRRRNIPCPMASFATGSKGMSVVDNIVLLAPERMLDRLEASDWIYRDVLPALQRMAKERGFHLILSSYGPEDQWKPAAMSARHISGVLWMARDREDLLAQISKTVPVVVINDNFLSPPQTSVICNNRMVLFRAVEHLRELGHRRIGYFCADKPANEVSVHLRERLAAYHEVIDHFGLDHDPELCILEQFGMGEHPQAVARAMDRMAAMSARPTAIVTSLTYAIQFLKETRKRSIAVPEDLSIVAIDNAQAAEWVDPSLTVVDCAFGRCAEVAVDLLLESRTSSRKYVKTVLVEPELIIRKSTVPPRS